MILLTIVSAHKKYSALENLFPCRSGRRLWTSPTDDNSSPRRASAVESTETQSKREAFHHRKWNNCIELKAVINLADHN